MNDNKWIILTASGQGTRFGNTLPKQYLDIAGKSVLAHSIAAFQDLPRIQGIVITHMPDDPHIAHQVLESAVPIWKVAGGAQRFESVANAMSHIREHASAEDWVLVHDAVRPCVHQSDLEKMIVTLQADPVGGILASRVKDTLKRTDTMGRIIDTVDRENCWHALTPQMFRFGILDKAIQAILQRQIMVTDDAQAVQLLGYSSRVVEADHPNPKLTYSQDLPLIEYLLGRKNLCFA